MRTVQQTIQSRVEAVELMAAFVVEHAWLQTGYRIKQCHGGDFTARQHKVAHADLHIHMGVDEALVNTFIAATQQHGALAV